MTGLGVAVCRVNLDCVRVADNPGAIREHYAVSQDLRPEARFLVNLTPFAQLLSGPLTGGISGCSSPSRTFRDSRDSNRNHPKLCEAMADIELGGGWNARSGQLSRVGWVCISCSLFPDQRDGHDYTPSLSGSTGRQGELNLLLFKDAGQFPLHSRPTQCTGRR